LRVADRIRVEADILVEAYVLKGPRCGGWVRN